MLALSFAKSFRAPYDRNRLNRSAERMDSINSGNEGELLAMVIIAGVLIVALVVLRAYLEPAEKVTDALRRR